MRTNETLQQPPGRPQRPHVGGGWSLSLCGGPVSERFFEEVKEPLWLSAIRPLKAQCIVLLCEALRAPSGEGEMLILLVFSEPKPCLVGSVLFSASLTGGIIGSGHQSPNG